MKKLLTLITALLLTVSCVFFATGCGKDPEYTVQDCFEVIKTESMATSECTLDDILGNEPTWFSNDLFAIKTKKALKITAMSYDGNKGHITITDSSILKEYKKNEIIPLENNENYDNGAVFMRNLVIEFKVL